MQRFVLLLFILSSFACGENPQRASPVTNIDSREVNRMKIRNDFFEVLGRHLLALENRDSADLKSTIPSSGIYRVILQDGTTSNTVSSFLMDRYQSFADTTQVMKTEVINSEIGNDFGLALVELEHIDTELNKNSKLFVSYGLKKLNGQWKVVNEHRSIKK